LNSAREWIKAKIEPKIGYTTGFNDVFLKTVINISRDVIKAYNTYDDIARQISRRIREVETKNKWHIIVYSTKCCDSYVDSERFYLDIYFGEMRLEIFSAGNRSS